MSASSLERAAVLIAAVVITALQVRSCERDRVRAQQVDRANAVADTFRTKYNELSDTYEDRMNVLYDNVDVLRAVRQQNHDLAKQLEALGADVLSLTNTVVGIEEQFRGDTTATRTSSGWEFPLLERKQYGDSWLEVAGTAALDTLGAASWSLGFSGRLGIHTTVSRLPDEQLRVDLYSDVPSLQVFDISGSHVLPDLRDQPVFRWYDPLFVVAGFVLGRL